ncbi:MAG: transglycosylase SLT domain-containing protein [Methylocella sp.]
MPRAREAVRAGAVLLCLIAAIQPARSGTAIVAPPARETAINVAQAPAKSFEMAVRYEHGEGVRQDYARAVELYCDAARQGDARAFFNLGWIYANGRGVPRDGAVAVGWWRKAADRGLIEAGNLLRLLKTTAPAPLLGCADPPMSAPAAGAVSAPPEIRAIVQHVAPSMGLDVKLVMAVIAAESAFNAQAVSKKNAKGLMQLMPETATRFGVRDPFDPEENIRGGTTYLRWLLTRFAGNVTLALAAYNAGAATVAFYGGVPPFQETVQYIDRIKRLYRDGD